jgi:AraC-like DNA-binding protein
VRDAVAYITRNYSEPIRIQDLAREAHTSESNLYASFKAQLGTSPIAYLNDYRLSLAANLLEESDARIGEIADSVGIEDSLYFSRLFKRTYGTSPIEYRKMHSKKSDSKDCKE